MRQKVIEIILEASPAVDINSQFLFTEMDSLGIATVMLLITKHFGIELSATDATPKNFKSVDSIVKMIEDKLQ